MKNKKAETPIWLIIALVLGVLVLVVLAIGFTSGWGQLWSRLTDWTGGGNTLESVAQTCQVSCSSGNKIGFCDNLRAVKELSVAKSGTGEQEIKSMFSVTETNEELSALSADQIDQKFPKTELKAKYKVIDDKTVTPGETTVPAGKITADAAKTEKLKILTDFFKTTVKIDATKYTCNQLATMKKIPACADITC